MPLWASSMLQIYKSTITVYYCNNNTKIVNNHEKNRSTLCSIENIVGKFPILVLCDVPIVKISKIVQFIFKHVHTGIISFNTIW